MTGPLRRALLSVAARLGRWGQRASGAFILLWTLALAAPLAIAQEWSAAPEPVEVDLRLAPPTPPQGWDTVHGAFLRIHGPPDATATLLRLARHGSESLPRLAEALQVPIGDTIHVYVARTDAEFRELQPGRPPAWADATAYPARGIIFLRLPEARGGTARPLEQVFDHELVHIVVGRAFAPRRPPQWLQEGIAQVMAGEHSPDTVHELARGMLGGGMLSLHELTAGFPADANRARMAYAQSADFVSWIQATYGPDALPTLIRELAAGRSVDAAVRAVTGELLSEVDSKWRARFERGLGISWIPLVEMDVLFALAGVMLLVGGVLRRRRFHQRLKEMEEEERLIDELLEQTRAQRWPDPGADWPDPGADWPAPEPRA